MNKRQVESIFIKLCNDIEQCYGNINKMKKLYKTAITEADIFYNSVLETIIQTRITELAYSDGSGAVYI